MAKRATTTVKAGKATVKGATKADRQIIDAAKASADEKATVQADETPEAQPTKTAKRTAAQRQFAKADRAGWATTPEEAALSRAVRGY